MPSYLLPQTQIVKKKKYVYIKKPKKLLFQLFKPHPHSHSRLGGTLINLYMNEKKFFGSGKGGPLRIEETN